MKTRFKVAVLGVIAALALLTPFNRIVVAQTAVTTTTLTAAVNSTVKVFPIASTTGVTVGATLFIDHELVTVNAVAGLNVTVQRGVAGTLVTAHANGVLVYVGSTPSTFYQNEVDGSCVRANELFLPHIVPRSGNLYECGSNGFWYRVELNGFPQASVAQSVTYTASGALSIAPGVHELNGTTLAMTLTDPAAWQEGIIMIIQAKNASAHTVTYTTGFNSGGAGTDVATFGGAIGDNMVIIAVNGKWNVITLRNVVLA